ncbi:TetR/AcrR family transcriptional regulator [Pseudarthrobacter sp. S9]|uniref:TetR/AcrR family transcriptional regulator n=1 Tax=Pseudarthrobacter sp. S9 TaxID=3418421 RepID=UPI003CFCA4DB
MEEHKGRARTLVDDSTTFPAPGRRARKKQQTKDLIAETAQRLFLERGFDAVTVTQVAEAADVSEQTVFNHFRTKEDLVYRRMEAFEDELLDAIGEREPGESVLGAFGRFLRSRHGLLHGHEADAREQLSGFTRMIAASAALRRREEFVFTTYAAALAGLIADETAAEEGDVLPRVAANAMIGVHRMLVDVSRRGILQGVVPQELAREIDRQAERAIDLLEHGLGGYAPKPAAEALPQP